MCRSLRDLACLLLIDVQRGFDEPRLGRRNNAMAEANVARLLATVADTDVLVTADRS